MSNPTSENPNLADTLLFEQFAMFATASDGIGRLRGLILQFAVQGRRCCTACSEDCGYTNLEDRKGQEPFHDAPVVWGAYLPGVCPDLPWERDRSWIPVLICR
jgi:hypothetical protein